MTRIISGSAGGRRIRTPSGPGTRPTSDRVREALFSAVDATVGSLTGLRFLDLYAGSGAIGLEARSRGAGSVTLVEQDRRAATVIRDNARLLGFGGVEVVTAPVARALAHPARAPYDVVFLDPPYALDGEELRGVLAALVDGDWTRPDSVVVVERASRDGEPPWPPAIRPVRSRRYGETTLWYGRAATSPE